MKTNSTLYWISMCLLAIVVTAAPTTQCFAQQSTGDIDIVDPENTLTTPNGKAQKQITDTAVETGNIDFYAELQDLLKTAPTRQIGQPGNDIVDQMIRNRFEEAAKQNNPTDPVIVANRDELLNKTDAMFAQYIDIVNKIQLADSGILEDVQSDPNPWYIRYTIDKPVAVVVLLLLTATLTLSTWYVQRRHELLVAGHCMWGTAVALIISSIIYNYATSDKPGEGEALTLDHLQIRASELAEQILDADYETSRELCKNKWWQAGRVTYPTATFVPGEANIHMAGSEAEPVRLYQVTPNLINPTNLPGGKFEGKMVYVGQALIEDLKPGDLNGAAVLIDFNTNNNWIDVIQSGASVIIFLQPPNNMLMSSMQAAKKYSYSPINVPRFYLTRHDLVHAFGDNWAYTLDKHPEIIITQKNGIWETRDLATDWLFIPGTRQPETDDVSDYEDIGRQLVHLQAYKDCASFVPELSPGATSATNLLLLDQLVKHFENNPPDRPILISAVNNHVNALNGEREFAYMMFVQPSVLNEELAIIRHNLANSYFVRHIYSTKLSLEFLEWMRGEIVTIGGFNFKPKQPIADMLSHDLGIYKKTTNNLKTKIKNFKAGTRPDLTQADIDRIQQEIDEIALKRADIVELIKLFDNHFKGAQYDEISPKQQANLQNYFDRVLERAKIDFNAVTKQHNRLLNNLTLRRRLLALSNKPDEIDETKGEDTDTILKKIHSPLPVTLGLTLDLTFSADDLGLFYKGTELGASDGRGGSDATRMTAFARYVVDQAETYCEETGRDNVLADTLQNTGGLSWQSYISGKFFFGAEVFHHFALPCLTLTGTHDIRNEFFTPDDTIDQIDKNKCNKFMNFALGYIPHLINSEHLGRQILIRGSQRPRAVSINLRHPDEFSIKMPTIPAPHTLVVAPLPVGRVPVSSLLKDFKMFGQVFPWSVRITDERGEVTLRGEVWQNCGIQAFAFDPAYENITTTIDVGENERRFPSVITIPAGSKCVERFMVMFEANQIDLIGLTIPLTLKPATSVTLKHALQGSLPRFFNNCGFSLSQSRSRNSATMLSKDGTGTLFLKPDTPFNLFIGKSLIINSNEKNIDGQGFASESKRLNNIVLTSAKDMWRLNKKRLDMLASKGVENSTALQYEAEAEAELVKIHEAPEGTSSQVAADQARGYAYNAYVRGKQTMDDLIKAVVIFLALIIPFCFFTMKLITPFTDINRQVGIFVGIFVLMVIVLQLVHPAFQIASTPQVVILAFIILGLTVFVAMILISRFNGIMNKVVEESQMSESIDASQSALAGVAFSVGVNNMKRRRIRTTLTALTIVLVTFTMLSVISINNDVEPTQLTVSTQTPYTGLLFHKPALMPIDPLRITRMRAAFTDDAVTVARAWTQQKDATGEYMPYVIKPEHAITAAESNSVEAKVVLGFEVNENGFISDLPLAVGRWFSSNQAHEIVLSVRMAEILGITPNNIDNQYLILNGQRLKLVGLLIDEELKNIRDLSEVPLLPYLAESDQARFEQNKAAMEEKANTEGEIGSLSLDSAGTTVALPIDVVFLPVDFARTQHNCEYRTLGIKFIDSATATKSASQRAWEATQNLMQYQNVLVTVGLEEPVKRGKGLSDQDAGQYKLASSSATAIGGVLKIAIPIILAGTIILNTMLSSVMERKNEINIYNSIGLNPTHVMVFFLAESLVFGMIGAVAGYLIGQVLSVIIAAFDLIQLNLNYSSMSVMFVIFLTIITVLLSTVYPAAMAARAAVPSGQRKWNAPQPEGNRIHVNFPFSYDARRVLGVCAYLYEFMKLNSEASTGNFLAKTGPVGLVPATLRETDAPDYQTYAMIFHIAPAPFDLGVNQSMEVYAYYDTKVKAHMLSVHLTRINGEINNWITVNQPFLETIRKYLLGWRSQKTEIQETYYKLGVELFKDAKYLPVVT